MEKPLNISLTYPGGKNISYILSHEQQQGNYHPPTPEQSSLPLLLAALQHVGTKEIPGAEHNAQVLAYFHSIGHQWVDNDEVAWCAAFANHIAKECGYPHTGKLNARSFLEIGEQVHTPKPGDIVVLWRESPTSWKGHVGFYINSTKDHIYVLGGNQSNEVNISPYPMERLVQFRRLSKA